MSGSTAAAITLLLDEVESDVQARINGSIAAELASVRAELEAMREIARTGIEHLVVTVGDTKHKTSGIRHRQFGELLTVAAQRLPVLLVGMAGSGKTHAAEQVAEALGRPFYAMSVGAQTSKSDIIGYMHATGGYVRTLFREAYENGGVFLMDEMDAGNANVLIQVNAALSNNYCAFPDGMVRRHADFAFIASANTFGNGANRQYVGRNQLDAATMDRFTIIHWMIDTALERNLAGTGKHADLWYRAVLKAREKVEKDGLRVLVTPRATVRGAKLLAAGVTADVVAEQALLNLFPTDKKEDFRSLIKNIMAEGGRRAVPARAQAKIRTSDWR